MHASAEQPRRPKIANTQRDSPCYSDDSHERHRRCKLICLPRTLPSAFRGQCLSVVNVCLNREDDQRKSQDTGCSATEARRIDARAGMSVIWTVRPRSPYACNTCSRGVISSGRYMHVQFMLLDYMQTSLAASVVSSVWSRSIHHMVV